MWFWLHSCSSWELSRVIALQSFFQAQLLCPGSARPRSNASLWSKQKLQGWGHKPVLIPWIYCRKLEHPWIIIQWKLCKRQIKEFHLQNVTRIRWFHTCDCRTWLGFISLQAIRKSVTNYLVSAVWHGVAASHDLWCECRTSKKPPKTVKRKLKVRRWAVGVELPKFCRWFWCRETSESLWKRAVLLSAGKLLITVCLCFPWISVELVPASLRGPNVCFMISWDHRLFP